MGYYIEQNSEGKEIERSLGLGNTAAELILDGAKIYEGNTFADNLVCVVDNGPFCAIGYAHNQREYEYFKRGFDAKTDDRPHVWLIYPHAKKLSGYEK